MIGISDLRQWLACWLNTWAYRLHNDDYRMAVSVEDSTGRRLLWVEAVGDCYGHGISSTTENHLKEFGFALTWWEWVGDGNAAVGWMPLGFPDRPCDRCGHQERLHREGMRCCASGNDEGEWFCCCPRFSEWAADG